MSSVKSDLPLIPLRDVVVFPGIVTTLFVGRAKSVEALNISMSSNKKLVLVSQKDASNEDPDAQDIFQYGSISNLLQLIKLPDGTMKVLVEGTSRVEINKVESDDKLTCTYIDISSDDLTNDNQSDALFRTLEDTFSNYVKLNKKVPPEVPKPAPAEISPVGFSSTVIFICLVSFEFPSTISEETFLKKFRFLRLFKYVSII